ncbi:MAG: GNAT family N-acetyltransferase [Candidatus Sericytochromatia bacterium]|nr:GNAT family N-acetyltransferase [Candidatus Sericytochromatia bacterium]
MTAIVPYQPPMAAALVAIWRAAAGEHHPIPDELWTAGTVGDPGFLAGDLLVAQEGEVPVGFVLTKRWRGRDPGCERYLPIGYVALMAVHPRWQGRGIGRRLLVTAESQLRAAGATKSVLAGSFHHFFAGVPDWATAARKLLLSAGYGLGDDVWDVRRSLAAEPPLPEVPPVAGVSLRPYRTDEAEALIGFLNDAFPGRWPRDVQHFLQSGGPIDQVMGLFAGDLPCGFAHLHPPGTAGAGRWSGLVPGIAALGPIGVSEAQRGRGLGMALLIAGLHELRRLGADEVVIDWTDLLDFYGRVGFQPWLRYTLASKALA